MNLLIILSVHFIPYVFITFLALNISSSFGFVLSMASIIFLDSVLFSTLETDSIHFEPASKRYLNCFRSNAGGIFQRVAIFMQNSLIDLNKPFS